MDQADKFKVINAGINKLAEAGLNIFTAISIDELSEELIDLLSTQNIPLHQYKTLCLLGNGGKILWGKLSPHFMDQKDPIDQYTLLQLNIFAKNINEKKDFLIIYPLDKWQLPLQKIGRFLNIARPSLLGIDLSLEYGPWFAYRAVFLSKQPIKCFKIHKPFLAPCETCLNKSCIPNCPAEAVTHHQIFNLSKCITFKKITGSKCQETCHARLNCSYQPAHKYTTEQIKYHHTFAHLLTVK